MGSAIAAAVCGVRSRSLNVLQEESPGLRVYWSQRCLEALL